MRELLLTLFIFLQQGLWAQSSYRDLDVNKIIPPSPTASSLGKYGEHPVSLYTGLVNIDQGLYTVKSGKLSLDISLSYHSAGNRPSDIPSWVGLGFSLNAGGVITRTVNERPDDTPGGYYTGRDGIKQLLLPNMFPTTTFLEEYIGNRADAKSDIYQFNFNGKSGTFVFDLNGNIKLLNKDPYKIHFDHIQGDNTNQFKSFTITTEDGLIYTFGQAEQTRFNMPDGSPSYYTSSWYLTKIQNLLGDNIVLTYTVAADNYRFKKSSSEKLILGSIDQLFSINDNWSSVSSSQDRVVYLNEIVFKDGKLNFATSKRNDPFYVPYGVSPTLAVEKKLDLITLSDNTNSVVKKWQFAYTENSGRLKLNTLSFLDQAASSAQQYRFEYNNTLLPINGVNSGSGVDPYETNSVDYWGFFNGRSNALGKIPLTFSPDYNQSFGSADRTPDPINMKAEILKKIVYPTGGYTEFEFEANDYGGKGESIAPEEASFEYQNYSFSYEDGFFNEDPSLVSFTLTEPTVVVKQRGIKGAGPNRAWMPTGTYEESSLTLAAGTYYLSSVFNTEQLLYSSNSDIHYAYGNIQIKKRVVPTPQQPFVKRIGPGLRIKSINTFDGSKISKRSFEYLLENSTQSSGVLSIFPAFYVTLDNLFQNSQGIWLSSTPINDSPSGPPLGYSRVVEILPDSSRIVHKYNTYLDIPDSYGTFFNGYSDERLAHLSSNNHLRGREISNHTYTKDGKSVRKIVSSYNLKSGSSDDIQALHIQQTFNIDFSSTQSPNPIASILSSAYYIPCRFAYKETEEEQLFDKNGLNPVTKLTRYFYDNSEHLQPTRIEVSSSDGRSEIQSISYPLDYPSGTPFIDNMKSNHLWSFPIEQVRYKDGSSGNILSGEINIYRPTGDGLKEQVLLLDTKDPISKSGFKFSNRAAGVLPPAGAIQPFSFFNMYRQQVHYQRYDERGNVLQYKRTGGPSVSCIWSDNKENLLAVVANAPVDEIYHQNFEEVRGFDAALERDQSKSYTGLYSGKISNVSSGEKTSHSERWLNISLSTAKKFIYSGWVYSSGPSAEIYLFMKRAGETGYFSYVDACLTTVTGKWVYLQKEFVVPADVVLLSLRLDNNSAGTVWFDDLRLYPSDASMNTYTYKPLIGVSSHMDDKGKVVKYEYDSFLRLSEIKDQSGMIINQFNYHYKP